MLIFLLIAIVVFGSIYLTFDKVFKNMFKPEQKSMGHVHTWEKLWNGYGTRHDRFQCTICGEEKYIKSARR